MKQWLFRKGSDQLGPTSSEVIYERGKQTHEGRKSDDYATDTHPELTDRQLAAHKSEELTVDRMEQGRAQPQPAVPRALMSTDPGSESTLRGRTRLAHAAANAIDKYMLGSSSDDDTAIPNIPMDDRYTGVKDRQAEFMKAALDNHTLAMSPFDRYRTRMGERTGSSGMVEAQLAQHEAAFTSNSPTRSPRHPAASPPNHKAQPTRNSSVDRNVTRLLVSNAPLRLAPLDSKPSLEIAATSERTPSGKVVGQARGSLEVSHPNASGELRRSLAARHVDIARRADHFVNENLSEGVRGQSIRAPMQSIEEGRTTHQLTRVQNVRVVQPRYLIPREFVYVFGVATTLGLCIGCVTLAIGIRNANYLRGPHSNTLIPDVQRQVANVTFVANAIAAKLGVDTGLAG